jgi:hypothetical protein
MVAQPHTNGEKRFTVVLRGAAALVFWENERLRIEKFPTAVGPVDLTYATRWLNRGENVRIPGHLWIEIVGSGESLEKVLVPYANAGIAALPLLSVASNVSIEDPEVELGFESTPGITQRDYFQCYLPEESGVIHVGRHVNLGAVVALLEALPKHSEAERFLRAANQYRLALDSWKLGRESLSLAHLWMALEALTKVKIRQVCSTAGLNSEPDLARHMGVELRELDPTVRKVLLLQNDEDCYTKAKAASDGFEHGFLGYKEIRDYAKDVRHRMAAHIRKAILELAGVPKTVGDVLLNAPFDEPLGHWPVAKYLRGRLLGDSPALAREGNSYPFVRWNPVVTSCARDTEDKLKVQISDNFTAELGDGISFQPQSVEIWQPD